MNTSNKKKNADDVMIGKSFGKLTVVAFSHAGPKGHKHYICTCHRCGKESIYRGVNIRLGKITSCKECWRHENRNENQTE